MLTDLMNNAPRRYFVDAVGQRVLIGLTLEETFEFERLDSEQMIDHEGVKAAANDDRLWSGAGGRRWLELYEKHEGAWKVWMAQSRTDRRQEFSVS